MTTTEVTPMSTTLEQPPAAPKAPVRSSMPAWLALSAGPVLYALAIWMAFFVLGDENIKWWGDVIVLALWLLPPVAGVVLGVRTARTGNGLGALAAAIGTAWLTFMLIFYLAANYVWSGESGTAPVALAVTTALLVGGVVEAGWYWLGNAGHHPA